VPVVTRLARNDPRRYDELAADWWDTQGPFAMLHWIARARAALVPPAERPGALLLDLGCGAGLLAPHVAGLGYRHLGVDLTASALRQAAAHGVAPARADVVRLPMGDAVADVVCAGEILEHVADHDAFVAEMCRVLRPGGTLVVDTIADTRLAALAAVEIPERLPIDVPSGLHDPALFVSRPGLVRSAARAGVELRLRGLRPSAPALLAYWAGRREAVPMIPTRSTAVLFQAWGLKSRTGTGTGSCRDHPTMGIDV
jgi:2-polyprenyl-6-hydroxyphenyl methylase/3-demethylubiquinone-9 3-methyltransferase